MARRYLGYGITNNQGIATLDHDPDGGTIDGYTGVGAGKVDIIATSGSLQSEIYELLDCLFYEGDWYNHSNRASVTTNEDGSISIENTTTSTAYYLANLNNTTKSSIDDLLDWDAPLAIEFELISTTGGLVQIHDGVTDASRSFSSLYVSEGVILIKFLQNRIEYYVNDVLTKTDNYSLNTSRIGFRLGGTVGNEVTFKNFKIYPI